MLALLLFLSPKVSAATGTNKQISFQGKVVNTDGTNVANDNYDFEFKLYSVSTGGTAIWTETRITTNQVTVTDGVFQVNLGSVTALPGSVDFNTDNIYLGINFNNNGEMTPRVQFTAVPQAFNALKVAGLTVTDTTGTFTLSAGKTLTVSNTLTLQGTDSTTFTFPSGSGTVVTLDSTDTLTNKTIGSTGLVFSGATTDIDTAATEGLTLQGRAASSFNTTAGNISFQPAGTGTIATVQIGAGGTGSTTPDFLGLDVKSDTGDPAGGFEGAMYYNTADDKFRCYQGTVWTDCISAASSSLAVRSFIDTTSNAVVDDLTTSYWDTAVENNNSFPNITLSSTAKSVYGIVTMETQSTVTQDVEVIARMEVTIGGAAPASCNSGSSVGGRPGTFSSNTDARKTSTTSFIYSPASIDKLWFNVCSDTDTVGVTANVTRLRVSLFEVDNSNADLAELYSTSDSSLQVGEVVSFDPSIVNGVKRSLKPYEKGLAGVISTDPALLIGGGDEGVIAVPLALAGRVPVKVSTENGSISPGDFLTSSTIPGVAMKSTKAGPVVGQAMTAFAGDGIGEVTVFIKNSYFLGVSLASLLPGLTADNAGGSPADFGKAVLARFIQDKNQGVSSVGESEILTDRLAAAKEIISPQIITDILYAKKIKADSIEGLEILTDKISSLQGQVAGLSTQSEITSSPSANPSASTLGNNAPVEFGSGRFTMDVSVLGKLRADGGLVVAGPSQFQGESIFEKLVSFISGAIFKGNVSFEEAPVFSKDTAGLAVVQKGADEVSVSFKKEYQEAPIITVGITLKGKDDNFSDRKVEEREGAQAELEQRLLQNNISYIITRRTAKGFVIKLNQKAHEDILFSWQALRVKEPNVFQGSTPIPEPSITTPTPSVSLVTPTPTVLIEAPSATPSAIPTP